MRYSDTKLILRSYYRYYYLITHSADDLLIEFEKNILESKISNLNSEEKTKIINQLYDYITNQKFLQEVIDDDFEKKLKVKNY